MTMIQYDTIGKLYLIGILVDAIWFFARIGGFKGLEEKRQKLAKEWNGNLQIASVIISLAFVLNSLIWPIFMHVGIKERLKG